MRDHVRFRLLLLPLSLFCCLSANAQLSGRFYLNKTTFASNEPIDVYFEIANTGTAPAVIDITGIPNSPACSGYVVTVMESPRTASLNTVLGNNCVLNGARLFHSIPPGKTYTGDILLNHYFNGMAPGDYWIQVKHMDQPSVEMKLHFLVTNSSIP
jgi:hypothetical protein